MAPGPSAAWPAGSPCTAAPRPAPTAPPPPTTANPSSPSAAGADRPSSRPTPGPRCGGASPDPTRGRTRRPPPTPDHKEQLVNRLHRTRNPSEIPGWGSIPGWSPLIDHGPLPLRMAGSVARWWWPTLTLAGFGTVVGIVLGHDDPTTPGLSTRGLATIALAALVVVLLTIHRTARPGA